tara:strand:- start:150 stop:389 length:240 start_codon:yes stop_codon:yes gene_type:complete
MAKNLNNVMTREDAIEQFERDILPGLIQQETEWQGGVWKWVDECHRSEVWNNWTDSLCKNNQISDWQYENWSHPDCCER